MKFINMFIVCLILTSVKGFAQEVPTPEPTSIPALDVVSNFILSMETWTSAQAGMIGVVLGIFVAIAKAVSTERAMPVIRTIQWAVDGVAKIVLASGKFLAKLAQLLADAIKSDGFLGKK